MSIKENLFYMLALVIVIALYSIQFEYHQKVEYKYKQSIDSIHKENELLKLKYDNVINAIKTKDEFIAQVYEIYLPMKEEAGILPSFLIGTAILESSNGESGLTKRSNNLFCIKGSYKNQCVYSKDDEIGLSKFRKYPSYEESIKDYIELMKTNRYCDIIGSVDYKYCAKLVKKKGYASHPEYTSKLIQIIEDNKLYLLDII